ncbi:MAG: outer membrane beta-barrel protein [Hyphomicrobiaceae bacterium]|nr:outer membrane beta-barrel protein [Hyphomicrobiaceae bacterium]
MYIRAAIFASGLLVAAGTSSSAIAADIYAPSAGGLKDPVISEEVIIPDAIAFQQNAEWFIRGDIGFGGFGDMNGKGRSTDGNFAVNGLGIDQIFSGSIGFGRYATPNIRLGIDLEYRHDADTKFNTGSPTTAPGLVNLGANSLQLNTLSVMASVIYDFRPRQQFSPYLGGGIGWATHNLTLKGSSYVTDLNGDLTNEVGSFASSSTTSNSFAANFVTGVSINMRRGLFLDLGYKLSYLGDASTIFNYSHPGVGAIAATSGSGSIDLEDMLAHEFKIGLRYDLY